MGRPTATPSRPTFLSGQRNADNDPSPATSTSSRRDWLQQNAFAAFTAFSTATVATTHNAPAYAKDKDEEPIYYDKAEVQKAFDVIRFELEDPAGGVAILQELVDKEDFDALFEFTKEYDLEFRKAKMQTTKKKFKINLATTGGIDVQQILNNVTFDLIGMNKSCRAGQQNIELTRKYLAELKVDIQKFLDLQSTILLIE